MTTKNKVVGDLPNITTYTTDGAIIDITLPGNVTAGANINGTGMTIAGDAIITGDANVLGNLTYNDVSTITTSNLVIGLGNNQTGINVTGAGIVVGNTNEASWLYNQPAQSWNSNIAISATGNITTGNYFIGNGSQLTGIIAGTNYTDSNVTTLLSSGTVASNIITTGNIIATKFIGDGNLLTNVIAKSSIVNGNSIAQVVANGNITMSVSNVANVVTVSTNSLRVNGNIYDATGRLYGVAASYAKYTRTTQQTTGLTANSPIICNVSEATFGNDITVNSSTGQITLAANKTYRLVGMVPGWTSTGTDVRISVCWYNENTSSYIGNSAEMTNPVSGANNGAFGGAAETIITTSAITVVSFRLQTVGGTVVGLGGNNDFNLAGSYPWVDVQVIGGQAPYTTVASGAKFTRTTDQTGIAANSVVICNVVESVFGTDIVVDTTSGNVTLQPGKTYRLRGTVGYCGSTNGANSAMSYQWYNASTNAWVGQGGGVVSPGQFASEGWNHGTAEYVVTPGIATVFQLRVVGVTTSNTIQSSIGGDFVSYNWRIGSPFIDVELIGQQAGVTSAAIGYGSYQVTPLSATGNFPLTATSGNLPVTDTYYVTLRAGNTYQLRASLEIRSTYAVFQWQTESGTILGQYGDSFSANSVDPGVSVPAFAFYTPTTDTRVKLVLSALSGYIITNAGYGEVSIIQIGGVIAQPATAPAATQNSSAVGGSTISAAAGNYTAAFNGTGPLYLTLTATTAATITGVATDIWAAANPNTVEFNGKAIGTTETQLDASCFINHTGENWTLVFSDSLGSTYRVYWANVTTGYGVNMIVIEKLT